MGLVRQSLAVSLPPEAAGRLWTDVRRWPTFIEGFAHVEALDDGWPAGGSKLVWQSIRGGRGRVTERVLQWVPPGGEPGLFSTRVYEESLSGTQTVSFESAAHGTLVELELDYELAPTRPSRQGALGAVTDVLFIRRALSDSLARTLRRFATEAASEREQGGGSASG